MANFKTGLTMSLVKSYEDACRELGILPTYPKFVQCAKIDRPSMIAYHKLIIIIRALNLLPNGKCWVPNFDNCEYKYGLWWHITSDNKLGFASVSNDPSYMYTTISSRLLFRSRSLAEYCAKQFKDLWSDYILM